MTEWNNPENYTSDGPGPTVKVRPPWFKEFVESKTVRSKTDDEVVRISKLTWYCLQRIYSGSRQPSMASVAGCALIYATDWMEHFYSIDKDGFDEWYQARLEKAMSGDYALGMEGVPTLNVSGRPELSKQIRVPRNSHSFDFIDDYSTILGIEEYRVIRLALYFSLIRYDEETFHMQKWERPLEIANDAMLGVRQIIEHREEQMEDA